MAVAMSVGDIMSVRAWLQLDEQGAVNTYNYNVISNTGGGATDQQLATAFDAAIGPFYQLLVPSTVEYRGVQVYFIKRTPGFTLPSPVKSIAAAGVGTATGNPIPRTAAPILKYKTPVRGPSGRGRLYLPFVADSFIANNGRPTNAFDVIVNSNASGLLSPLVVGGGGNTSTLVWSVIHKAVGTPPITRGQITEAESADKVGQMHKRGDYGRANASPI